MADFNMFKNDFIIKKEHDDYVVKEYIGNITGTLSIPEGVTRISRYAFSKNKCTKINKIVFPKTLKRIPDCNFEHWDQLEEIIISEGVTTISEGAFLGTGIKSVLLPSTIDKIGKYAFSSCDNLKKITTLHLTESLLNALLNENYSSGYPERKLNFYLYFGFSGDIEFSEIFNKYYNPQYEKFKFSICGEMIMYGNHIVGYIGREKDLRIPDSAIGIAAEAFLNRKDIYSVKMGKKIKVIGDSAFEGCKNLKSVALNDTIEKIGAYAFSATSIKSIIIPIKVTYVGERAFKDCNSLQSITIKKGLYDSYRISQWDLEWNYGFYKPLDYDIIL